MEHILSLSYGKDSLACLEACKLLGYSIDRVIHAEVWATDTILAELPPMIEFKAKADRIIKERYGLTVEHFAAERDCHSLNSSTPCTKKERTKEESTDFLCNEEHGVTQDLNCNPSILTYEQMFYQIPERKSPAKEGQIRGFPISLVRGNWCTRLKLKVFRKAHVSGRTIQYLGIAADEPERIERHKDKPGIVLPLVDIGWNEAYCRKWCEENDLLSPIYTNGARGGCWFCHNQSIDQLRHLRKEYPELWELLLKWDWDSPVTFHPDGRTVHDFDLRFYTEDLGLVPADRRFRWKVLDNPDFYKEDK